MWKLEIDQKFLAMIFAHQRVCKISVERRDAEHRLSRMIAMILRLLYRSRAAVLLLKILACYGARRQ